MERIDVDWEYVSPENVFSGQLRMGVGKNDSACFAESNFTVGEGIDFTACKRNAKSGLVCDLNRQNGIAVDFINSFYTDGYTLVICVNRDGEIINRKQKAENGKPKGNNIPDGMTGSLSAGLSDS